MIVKTFRKKGHGFAGQDSDSWSDSWGGAGEIEGSFRNAERTHLAFFFKKYFPKPPSKILEGGCGTGKYVYAYRRLGYDIIGVDFAAKTVKLINDAFPELPVHEGNVLKLPFKDGEFDCYYSGGVIEHFEDGPDSVIKEARRVLKKDGIFLATVPYINQLRKSRFIFYPRSRRGDLIQIKVDSCERSAPPGPDYDFCEYMFDHQGIICSFEKNGFKIDGAYPIDFLWGEMGSLIRVMMNARAKPGKNTDIVKPESKTALSKTRASYLHNILFDLLVMENRENKFFLPMISLMNNISGHMLMLVGKAV